MATKPQHFDANVVVCNGISDFRLQALSWCPWRRNILASGGGSRDGYIRIWNVSSGALKAEVNTHMQVSALKRVYLPGLYGVSLYAMSMSANPTRTQTHKKELVLPIAVMCFLGQTRIYSHVT